MNARPTDSVYNDPDTFPVWKEPQTAPAPAAGRKLSPRAKAGIAVGGVALAATTIVCWSQYETAQASADVAKAQIALEQQKLNLQLAEQQTQAAKASGQETPAQAARREAMEKCVAAAGDSYNGVSSCASAYPVIDPAGTLNDTQATASSTPTGGGAGSPVGLVVLAGVGGVVAVGAVKKRLARS